MKKDLKLMDAIVIGFALFAMFFGAGNVIFPPYLGLQSGPQWLIGFICYFIADIGLALLVIFAMIKMGSTDDILAASGKIPAVVLMFATALCLGPMLAIPRTAATTFEMSIMPLIPSFPKIVFSILFFALVLFLCLKESAVVDIVGKVLTPFLLVGLIILIIVGIARPIGEIPSSSLIANVPIEGVKAGYQTMDVLAALVFGTVIAKSALDKGYEDKKKQSKVVAVSGIIAAVLLLIVYGGLTYLGAGASAMYGLDVDRSVLVVGIIEAILGKAGLVIFALVVAFACLTTAIGLTTACADTFSKIFKNKLSYKVWVIIISVFSVVVSNFGLNTIISIAAPILDVVYPPILVLIICAFISRKLGLNWSYKVATLGAFLFSFISTLGGLLHFDVSFLGKLPFSNLGFGWLVPAIVCFLIGFIIDKVSKKPQAAA